VTVCREQDSGSLGFGNVVNFYTFLATVSSYSDLITGILKVLCRYVNPSLLVFEQIIDFSWKLTGRTCH